MQEFDYVVLQLHYVDSAAQQFVGVCGVGEPSACAVVELYASATDFIEVEYGVPVGIDDVVEQSFGPRIESFDLAFGRVENCQVEVGGRGQGLATACAAVNFVIEVGEELEEWVLWIIADAVGE